MRYRDKKTEEIINEGQFREKFPNTSFPSNITKDIADEYGYKLVLPLDNKVEFDETTFRITGYTIKQLDDGSWQDVPVIIAISSEELAQRQKMLLVGLNVTLVNNVQAYLDAVAQELGYDNISTAITYQNDKNPKFAAEAQALKDWRSDVWTCCFTVLTDVQARKRNPPIWEDLLSKLPLWSNI